MEDRTRDLVMIQFWESCLDDIVFQGKMAQLDIEENSGGRRVHGTWKTSEEFSKAEESMDREGLWLRFKKTGVMGHLGWHGAGRSL